MYDTLVICASTIAAVLSVLSILLSCIAISVVVGFKNSTHNVQYMPIDNPFSDVDVEPPTADFRPEVGNGVNPFTKERRVQEDELTDYDEALLGGDWSNRR